MISVNQAIYNNGEKKLKKLKLLGGRKK